MFLSFGCTSFCVCVGLHWNVVLLEDSPEFFWNSRQVGDRSAAAFVSLLFFTGVSLFRGLCEDPVWVTTCFACCFQMIPHIPAFIFCLSNIQLTCCELLNFLGRKFHKKPEGNSGATTGKPVGSITYTNDGCCILYIIIYLFILTLVLFCVKEREYQVNAVYSGSKVKWVLVQVKWNPVWGMPSFSAINPIFVFTRANMSKKLIRLNDSWKNSLHNATVMVLLCWVWLGPVIWAAVATDV